MNAPRVTDESQCRRARQAYLLYLANVSILPGIGFIWMLVMWRIHGSRPPFVNAHFQQTTFASIMAGVLLAMVSTIILAGGGFGSPWTWVILIIYFTLCHAGLLLLGVFGFTRANNGQSFEFFKPKSWRQ